jgi:hypothetical protein
MTPSQSKRIQNIFNLVQNIRRALDKEASTGGIGGVAKDFGTHIDLDDAIFGILYTEKALSRIYERESFIRELPERSKARLKVIKHI